MSYETRNEDAALAKAIEARIVAGNKQAVAALRKLVNWVPESGFSKKWPLSYPEHAWEDEKKERARLNEARFASEAYLYQLLGKEDARTFRALLHRVAATLGLEDGLHSLEYPAS